MNGTVNQRNTPTHGWQRSLRSLAVVATGLLGATSMLVAVPSVASATGTLTISTTTLPGFTIGTAYTAQLAATGGNAPYTWKLAVGSAKLPKTTGSITGTPSTKSAPSTVTVEVLDTKTGKPKTQNTATTSLSIGPATVPGAPTGVTATSNADASSVVSWTAPTSDGGSAITGYTVTSSPGASPCATSTTSCTVTSLANGTAYTFTVTASNFIGTGSPSSASAPATPAVPAGPPVLHAANGLSVLDGDSVQGTISASGSPGGCSGTVQGTVASNGTVAAGHATVTLTGITASSCYGVLTGASLVWPLHLDISSAAGYPIVADDVWLSVDTTGFGSLVLTVSQVSGSWTNSSNGCNFAGTGQIGQTSFVISQLEDVTLSGSPLLTVS